MTAALMARVQDLPGVTAIRTGTLESFLARPEPLVLFFTGFKKGRTEASDVAVILLEMKKLYGDRLVIGLVADEDEEVLRQRFGVRVLPSLVLVKDGDLMRVLPRIQDWPVYLESFQAHLGSP